MENKYSRLSVDLSGRVAIVTGASRGIGKAVALALAENGAKVACVATSQERLVGTVEEIRALGAEAEPFACNVGVTAEVQSVVETVIEKWGKVDILVNNAGITRDTMLATMKDEDWDAVIQTNLRGVFLFTRACIVPMMQKRYGRIVNVSSVSGLIGNPGQANYSASKAGVIGFTNTVAREYAKRKITANVVAPGFISTDMTAVLNEMILTEAKKRIPLNRVGEPGDIADAVLFLASEAASYITGQVIPVDGGMTA
ncbi:MAG: 3-oxoacyl-[acyl-carrier-protein] reductase [Planctomycetia bacterium]|nr:3-oxoacyl-[acyl-carrier-protein] reductase [Planctomycetia bacterium]